MEVTAAPRELSPHVSEAAMTDLQDVDPVSSNSHLLQTFTMHHLLPLPFIAKDRFKGRYQTPTDPLDVVVGSVADCLELPCFRFRDTTDKQSPSSMRDVFQVSPNIFVARREDDSCDDGLMCVIESSQSLPGFVRLRVTTPSLEKSDSAKVTSEGMYLRTDTHLLGKHQIVYSEKENETCATRTVVAVRVPHWPLEALTFVKRERPSSWPDQTLLREAVSTGAMLLPKEYFGNKGSDLDWCLTFSRAEQCLSQSLNDSQRQALLILKLLLRFKLSRPTFLTMYHLKTVFFWICEDIPQSEWTNMRLSQNVLAVLNRLTEYLQANCLPNYFIPGMNLLQGVHEDFISTMISQVKAIMRDPLDSLLVIDELIMFPFSLELTKHSTIIRAVRNVVTTTTEDVVKFQLITASVKISEAFLVEHMVFNQTSGGTKFFFVDACFFILRFFYEEVFQDTYTADDFLNLLIKYLEGELLVHYLMFRAEHDKTNRSISTHATNLACQFAVKALTSEPERQEVLRKEALFLHQLATEDARTSSACLFDFAKFCAHVGENKTAMKLLQKAVEFHPHVQAWGDMFKNLNGFDSTEAGLLSPTLQKELQKCGTFTAPSLILTLHYMVGFETDELMQLELVHQVERYADLLKTADFTDNFVRDVIANTFALVGHSLEIVNDQKSASEAFAFSQSLLTGSYPGGEETVSSGMQAMSL